LATRKQKAKVGFFLVVCTLIIAGGILLISGYKKEPSVNYWIEFSESVLGLASGSQVMYLGVPIGTVSDIYVTHENKAHVTIKVNPNKVTLHEGVQAQLVLYSLATGTMSIILTGGELDQPALRPGSEIPSKPSLVESVSSRIESILSDLDSIIGTVKTGLVGMQEGDLAEVVDDAGQLIKNANETMANVKENAEGGIDDFRKLIQESSETVSTIRQKIQNLDLDKTSENFNQALDEIAALAQRLQDSVVTVNDLVKSAEHRTGNLEYSFRETLKSLNDSLNAIRELADFLKNNPSALVRGRAAGEQK